MHVSWANLGQDIRVSLRSKKLNLLSFSISSLFRLKPTSDSFFKRLKSLRKAVSARGLAPTDVQVP